MPWNQLEQAGSPDSEERFTSSVQGLGLGSPGRVTGLKDACLLWGVCLFVSSGAALSAPVEIVFRPLPTNCPVLGDGLGRVHTGPAHWTIEGGARGAGVGIMLSRTADFDGNGRPEWALAAPKFPVKGREVGKVWVLAFGSNGMPRVVWSWEGASSSVRAGTSLAAGDFDGDGRADLAVGSPNERERGEVLIFNGSRTNLSFNPILRLSGFRAKGKFGSRLMARDVNQDGRDDLVVGAASLEPAQSRVLLFLGTPQGLSNAPAWVMDGTPDGRRMGAQLALLDANGDGRLDLAVGTPNYGTVTATNLGRVDVFLGTNGVFAVTAVWSMTGRKPGAMFGESVWAMRDLDQDGRDELAVSSDGQTSIYHGTPDGLSDAPAWTKAGASDVEADKLRGVGDINGDGWNDAMAAESSGGPSPVSRRVIQLLAGGASGLAKTPEWTAEWYPAETRLGCYLTAPGDLDGDGLMDFAMAWPNYAAAGGTLPRAGRIDIFRGRRTGYRAEDTFPTDGINSQSRARAVAEMEQAGTAAAKPVILRVPTKQSRWWAAGMAATLAAGLAAFVWSRARHRRAASVALQSERERIARDLHDGVGSSLHGIQRLTEMLNAAPEGSPQALRCREELLAAARKLGGSMDRVIWSVKPENDTLENLVTFLAAYAPGVLGPAHVACELDLPPTLPPMELRGETRHHLFLAVNEALNNVVRHAQASRAWLRIRCGDGRLEIAIEDDGVGLATAARRPGAGNGLKNLRERMARIDGSAEFGPGSSRGILVVLKVPLASAN